MITIIDIVDENGFKITVTQDILEYEINIEKNNKILTQYFNNMKEFQKTYERMIIVWRSFYEN